MVDHPRQPRAPLSFRQDEPPAPPAADAGERVAKALARAGVASRREVERLIAEGRVALNGRVLATPAVKVGPRDILTVNGQVVDAAEPTRLWRYHKPVGLVTTHNDPGGRPTVFQALPEGLPRVISVGRLDLNSEGLLLLTNDGALARALELPSNGWVRQYRARAFGRVDQPMLDRLRDGITVEGVVYGAIEARLDKLQHKAGEDRKGPANAWISLSITEGKNREVRRVLEALGLKVNRLIRLAYGPFALGTLESGAVEEVGPRVIREQLAQHIAAANLPTGVKTSAPARGAAEPRPAASPPPDAPRQPARRGEGRGGKPSPAHTPPSRPRGTASSGPPAKPVARGKQPPRPGAKPASHAVGGAPSAGGGRAAVVGEAEKPAYKPGWARPKRKANPHAAPSRPARGKGEGNSTVSRKPIAGPKAARGPSKTAGKGGAPSARTNADQPARAPGPPRPRGKTHPGKPRD